MSRRECYVRYNHSPKGQARYHRYLRTEARRRCVHRYNTNLAGHAAAKRYRAKPAVREQRNWIARSNRRARKLRENAL